MTFFELFKGLLLLFNYLLFIIYFTLSLWTLYYSLELQWMLLAIFFIIGTSIFRGLLNYLIINAILSIGLIIGILMSNSLLLIISCYGKVGYYPFFLVLSMLFYNTSYLFILFDLINKWAYFSSFILILNISIFFRCSEYWLVLINLMIVIYFIRLISSIKHIIFISSYLLFIFIYLLILLNNYLFSYLFLLFYIYLTKIILIKCNFLYVHWIIPLLNSLNIYYLFYLYIINLISSHCFIFLSSLILYLLFLIIFSFIPFLLFFSKFFFIILILYQFMSLLLIILIFISFIYYLLFIYLLVIIYSKSIIWIDAFKYYESSFYDSSNNDFLMLLKAFILLILQSIF